MKSEKRRQNLKMAAAVFLVVVIAVTGFSMCSNDAGSGDEVRGVWVSYVDFNKLGLADKSETEFRENAEVFFDQADDLHINTVYFHVRVFRDAVYKSDIFPLSRTIWSQGSEMPYDPLEIMIELAEEHNMELHAWLNPYRNYSFEEEILDPADQASTDEILTCVNEIVKNYDVAGIHFDDYFYKEGDALDTEEKMHNVNIMVAQVYEAVHNADSDMVFGISPAGNIAYSESLGADVKTWLSEIGYVDYIVPQIYWTDEHTATWRDKMFTDTLDEWMSINEREIPLYVGLALYKAGTEDADDPGWKNRCDNLSVQIEQLRNEGTSGYVFFSASDFFRAGASEELNTYHDLVF